MSKVLIIEDELLSAQKWKETLKGEGYNVEIATDGVEGLEKARQWCPEVIILDIMLPGLDGLSLCRILRKDTRTQNIGIIMLTARALEVDKIVGLESGADDYLVKPVSLGELLARIRAFLRRKNSMVRVGDELESGDLRIVLSKRRFYKGGKEVSMTNKEFDILVELMRNPGVVLSRDLLLMKVWGNDSFIDKRTVDVHMRWIREKIEVNASNPERIVTVRGVGYRFEG